MELGVILGLVAVAGLFFYLSQKREEDSPFSILFLLVGLILVVGALFSMSFFVENYDVGLISARATTITDTYGDFNQSTYDLAGDFTGHTNVSKVVSTTETTVYTYAGDYGEHYTLYLTLYQVVLLVLLIVLALSIMFLFMKVAAHIAHKGGGEK